ncbi:glycosyltransferase [Gaiella sp.]|uniref:glycosyltransferase n=1 Tax=Gaiella sp. TaxID=2663207 RepID=UPI002E2FF229|nr:glycosyltransferase [Gaiella sp.]HEX5582104.1 glycosyltransferase [Gaiella sp.]
MASPLVSVVLAARDAERTIADAVRSVLGQTERDLELVVVDDGSADATGELVRAHGDERVRVVRNDEPLGLAGALNVGLDAASGTYLARMDADDVALPHWLERTLGRLRTGGSAVVGAGMIDLDAEGRLRTVHRMPGGARAVRWAALFSSPFFHSTVAIDRSVLDGHGLRYDPSFEESEDYDLWARLLAVADGDNVHEALVLYRKHETQASARRATLQRECQRRVALRQIGALAPDLDEAQAELAWLAGAGLPLPDGTATTAASALERLVEAFERRYGGGEARRAASWSLARARVSGTARAQLAARALRLDPALPALGVGRRRARDDARAERAAATSWHRASIEEPVRVVFVLPEPTPYRTPMLDRAADRSELELTAIYAGASVQRRAWATDTHHRAVVLDGWRVPGAYRVLRHDYPIGFDVFGALADAAPEVVVVSGWSTFASQAAVAWCRRNHVPYVLLVESNERDARAGWRRTVKGAVVPRTVRNAAEVLVVGTLARESMLARGVDPDRISLFADTIDPERFGSEVDRLRPRRDELRAEAGLEADDVAVLCVARLSPEKGHDTLIAAAALLADPRVVVLLAGGGPDRARLQRLAAELGVRLVVLPELPWERIVERYAVADVFALLSRHEPWGVAVNEAAACGLPLVLSDRVGAAFDLLEDGRNGMLVPADDAHAAADALEVLVADPALRAAFGDASRERMSGFGYEPSIDNLVAVVRRVARRGGRHF